MQPDRLPEDRVTLQWEGAPAGGPPHVATGALFDRVRAGMDAIRTQDPAYAETAPAVPAVPEASAYAEPPRSIRVPRAVVPPPVITAPAPEARRIRPDRPARTAASYPAPAQPTRPARAEAAPERPWHGGNPLIARVERNAAWYTYLEASAYREHQDRQARGRIRPDEPFRGAGGALPFNVRSLREGDLISGPDGLHKPTRDEARAAINALVDRGYAKEVGTGYYELTPLWYEQQYRPTGGLRDQVGAEITARAQRAVAARPPRDEGAEWRRMVEGLRPPAPDA